MSLRLLAGACLALAILAGDPLWAAAPLTVVDGEGRTVTLDGPPRRIVSLAPHITEVVFDLGAGDRLVGTVRFSDWPPEAKDVPRVGDAWSASVETIVALKPDLVLAWADGGLGRPVAQIEALGIPVYFDVTKTLDQIAQSQERLGTLLGASETGATRARATRARLAELRATAPDDGPRAFFQIADQNLYTVSGAHFIGEALTLCGASNIFDAQPLAVPTVGVETVVAANPELIVISRPLGVEHTWESKWLDYPSVAAVRFGQIKVINADLISRPGTRLIDGVARLCEMIGSTDGALRANRH
ncbi:MAG: cobalamin-binding protein [Gammaproteobacteria bacterium]|nr:cobalamin-binding protein [Gammaproteobacteria bacterium]